jgi:ABC-2 type transport system permease protein
VRARRTGLLRRALASPSPLGLQLLGMAIGWFALALTQSLLIVVIGRVAFDVHWGDPVAGALLVVLFAIVGCGAGLLVGALGSNEDRVGATTPVVGICIGAIGGCTVPLEVFPSSMRALARVTPHYWAIDAWESLIDDGASVADIGGNLAVLGGFAIVMLVAATWSMRRALVRM